jgi:hypothetical protein
MTSGPNCGSRFMPMMISRASGDHLLHLGAPDGGVGHVLLGALDQGVKRLAHLVGVLHADDDAAYVRLVQDIGRGDLHHHGVADLVGSLATASSGVASPPSTWAW